MTASDKARLMNTIRNLMAQGQTDADAIIKTASDVIGGGDANESKARKVWREMTAVLPPN